MSLLTEGDSMAGITDEFEDLIGGGEAEKVTPPKSIQMKAADVPLRTDSLGGVDKFTHPQAD